MNRYELEIATVNTHWPSSIHHRILPATLTHEGLKQTVGTHEDNQMAGSIALKDLQPYDALSFVKIMDCDWMSSVHSHLLSLTTPHLNHISSHIKPFAFYYVIRFVFGLMRPFTISLLSKFLTGGVRNVVALQVV